MRTATDDDTPTESRAEPPAVPGPANLVIYLFADQGFYQLRVVGSEGSGKVALHEARASGASACEQHLRGVYDRFFREGDGAEYTAQKARLAGMEKSLAEVRSQLAGLRSEWERTVIAGSDAEIQAGEDMIAEQERKLRRLEIRLGDARANAERVRSAAAAKLPDAIRAARQEFHTAAEAEAEARRGEMAEAVNALFLPWLTAVAKRDGAVTSHLEKYFAKLIALPE